MGAKGVRTFLLDRANQYGAETTQKLTTFIRAFLQYFTACAVAQDDLDIAMSRGLPSLHLKRTRIAPLGASSHSWTLQIHP